MLDELWIRTDGTWRQETYTTASLDAGRRARRLRKLGYNVTTFRDKPDMTIVDIRPGKNQTIIDVPE